MNELPIELLLEIGSDLPKEEQPAFRIVCLNLYPNLTPLQLKFRINHMRYPNVTTLIGKNPDCNQNLLWNQLRDINKNMSQTKILTTAIFTGQFQLFKLAFPKEKSYHDYAACYKLTHDITCRAIKINVGHINILKYIHSKYGKLPSYKGFQEFVQQRGIFELEELFK